MKRVLILLSVLFVYSTAAYSQPNQSVRYIKIGNTYRETNQFKEAERVLMIGLTGVRQQRDRYWEAVACENLGLLYRDTEDSLQAIRYIDTASKLYQQLNLEGSRIAMVYLAESIRKRAASYAGIDIGSTGIKMSIIQVTLGREGRYVYNATKDTSINTNFADLNSSAFEATKSAIQRLLTIANKQSITEDRVFIAFSSGVLQAVRKNRLNTDSISKIFENLAKSIISSYTRPIAFLSADEEARYTNIGIVLPKFKERSVSIDIGGGNTKGGYYNSNGTFESFSLPFGSRFLTLSPTDTLLPEIVRSELKLLNQKAGIQNKREVFFLGGIIWAMINILYPEKSLSDYVEFTYNDVENFRKLATADYVNMVSYTQDKINRITDKETVDKATKNLADVENTFTADNLRRGSLLMGGIVNELNIPTLKKRYYFLSKGGYVAWITGYVVSNIADKYRNAKE